MITTITLIAAIVVLSSTRAYLLWKLAEESFNNNK